jgi:hypothetical protein
MVLKVVIARKPIGRIQRCADMTPVVVTTGSTSFDNSIAKNGECPENNNAKPKRNDYR